MHAFSHIIFEDEYLILINKPAGADSQAIAQQMNNNWQAVHRLDQRVSGLLLIAKNREMFAGLSQLFANRQVEKKYRAIVANLPSPSTATLEHWLVKDIKKQKAKVFSKEVAHSKKVALSYKLAQSSNKYHLLEIDLHTGRFHQIRAQLAAISNPILGDVKYGYSRTMQDGSIFLQSFHLGFIHPTTNEKLIFELPIPELWQKYGF